MVKNLTGRKVTVLDDLGIKGGGQNALYAILQYDNKDKNNKSVFKLGLAKNFSKRLDAYHTSSGNNGVWIKALITNIPKPLQTRSGKKKTMKMHLLAVEKFLFSQMVKNGSTRVESTTHIRDGLTELFYCTEQMIDDAFNATEKKYGGICNIYSLDDKKNKETFEERTKKIEKNALFVGKIIFV
jgi:hypothetical protein